MKLHKRKYLNVSKSSILGDSRGGGGGWLWPHPGDATAQFDAGAGKMAAELAEQQSTSPQL